MPDNLFPLLPQQDVPALLYQPGIYPCPSQFPGLFTGLFPGPLPGPLQLPENSLGVPATQPPFDANSSSPSPQTGVTLMPENTMMLPPANVEVGILHGIAVNKENGVGNQYETEAQALESLRSCVDMLNTQAAQSGSANFVQNAYNYDAALSSKDGTPTDLTIVNGNLQLSGEVEQVIHQAFQWQNQE